MSPWSLLLLQIKLQAWNRERKTRNRTQVEVLLRACSIKKMKERRVGPQGIHPPEEAK